MRWRAGAAGQWVTAAFCLLMAPFVNADGQPASLPNPLTLDQALGMADAAQPDLELARARLEAAQAGLARAESNDGLRVEAGLTPQTVLPSLRTNNDYVNDSFARLLVQKPLYDFGRTAALTGSARAEIAARELGYLDARQARRLDIMARFFDVLLADLRYAVDNEAMAESYVTFDKSRERHRVGQISDIDLLQLENRYQDRLVARTRSQKRQAQTRLQLAVALDRPDDLPSDLALPRFPGNDRAAPDYKALYETARQKSPVLLALRRETEAAREQVAAERARRYPVLSAEGELARYERDFASRSDVRAMLNLRIPLWQGGEDSAAIGLAVARLHEAEAREKRAGLDLRQTVLDLVQELESLKVERNAAKVRNAYRDLYLDRSRALYELEVRTDLGDAMTRVTEAQWQAANVEFGLALAWARVDALTGELVQSNERNKNP